MASIQQTIIDKSLEQLATSEYFDPRRIESLRKFLYSEKAIKTEQLTELFAQPQGGGLE
jgi:hypothetical protein